MKSLPWPSNFPKLGKAERVFFQGLEKITGSLSKVGKSLGVGALFFWRRFAGVCRDKGDFALGLLLGGQWSRKVA